MSRTRELLHLLEHGYRLYTGPVPDDVYWKKRCPHPDKAEWLTKPISGEHRPRNYICLGCDRVCAEQDGSGWQILLPVAPSRPALTAFVSAWPATAEELLNSRVLLRVDEAAWILNVSTKTIYRMLHEGKLRTVEGSPLRITTESLRPCLAPMNYVDRSHSAPFPVEEDCGLK